MQPSPARMDASMSRVAVHEVPKAGVHWRHTARSPRIARNTHEPIEERTASLGGGAATSSHYVMMPTPRGCRAVRSLHPAPNFGRASPRCMFNATPMEESA